MPMSFHRKPINSLQFTRHMHEKSRLLKNTGKKNLISIVKQLLCFSYNDSVFSKGIRGLIRFQRRRGGPKGVFEIDTIRFLYLLTGIIYDVQTILRNM